MSGPLVIGPQQPALNTVMPFTGLPADSIAIYVQNYSRFTLLVSFGATAPTATDSLNNQYDGMLAPGGRDIFYVQSRGASRMERSLNAMGAFTGNVWIMPVDRTGSLANAGTVSGQNDIWVSIYGPNDPLPPFPGGMPLNVDLSSQARVIAIPPAGGQLLNGTWNTATFATQGIALFALSATNIALQAAQLYLFHLGMYQQLPAAVAAPAQTRVAVQAQFQTSGFVNVGSPVSMYIFPFINYLTATQFATTNIVLTPFFPICSTLTVPATAAWLAVNLVKVGGVDTQIQFDYQMWLDPNNAGPPASYGGNAGPQRWAGQYSSQAGIW